MASGGDRALWDRENQNEKELLRNRNKNLIHTNREKLIGIIEPSVTFWAVLKDLEVIDREKEESLKVNSTKQETVSKLLDYLEVREMWRMHGLLRACICTEQPHVVQEIGLDPNLYRDHHPLHLDEGLGSRKVHYYCPPDSKKKIPIPEELMPGILQHCELYKKNLMKSKILNLEALDSFDLNKCFVDTEQFLKVNQKEWTKVATHDIFKRLEEDSAPNTVIVDGVPGAGKTTFLKQYAFTWAKHFTECEGRHEECSGHDWILVAYVPPGSMTNSTELAIRKNIKGKARDKSSDTLRDYAVDNGEGVLIEFDALDEIPDPDILERIDEFLENCKEQGPINAITSCRTNEYREGHHVFDRSISIKGFTVENGLAYVEKYLTKVHSLQQTQKDILQYIREQRDSLEMVLSNPLQAHILSELTARNSLTVNDLKDLDLAKLLFLTEVHILRRETEGRLEKEKTRHKSKKPRKEYPCRKCSVQRESDSSASGKECHATSFYRLCLECLFSRVEEIPEDLMEKFQVGPDSPYMAFLSKICDVDNFSDTITCYSFLHKAILEYFAARGLIDLLHSQNISTTTKRAILLSLYFNKQVLHVLVLTFGFICKYQWPKNGACGEYTICHCDVNDLDTHLEAILRGILFLFETNKAFFRDDILSGWSTGDDVQSVRKLIGQQVLLLQTEVESLNVSKLLSEGLDGDLSVKVNEMWETLKSYFNECRDQLKLIGWISLTYLHEKVNSYDEFNISLFMINHLLNQTANDDQRAQLYGCSVNRLLPSACATQDASYMVCAVGEMRWAMLEQRLNVLTVIAACLEDALEALKYTDQMRKTRPFSHLKFKICFFHLEATNLPSCAIGDSIEGILKTEGVLTINLSFICVAFQLQNLISMLRKCEALDIQCEFLLVKVRVPEALDQASLHKEVSLIRQMTTKFDTFEFKSEVNNSPLILDDSGRPELVRGIKD